MKQIVIRGGRRLEGALPVQGAKNSVLPVLAATILHPGVTVLRGCPRLSDVDASIRILRRNLSLDQKSAFAVFRSDRGMSPGWSCNPRHQY